MAELIAGEEKTRLALSEDSLSIGRHSEDRSFTPDLDLGDLQGGRTVSRHHARLSRRDGQWFLKVETATTNATFVAGQPLTAGQEVALKDGDAIVLGKIPLTFRADPAPPPNPGATIIGGLEPTAELRAEGRTYPLVAPEGRQLTLGRHSDDHTYNPDLDLGDLASGRTVSRRHGLLSYRGDQWFLKVEAAVTNPTLLNGTTLAHGQEVALEDGNEVTCGRVVVTFHQLKRTPTVGAEVVELIVDPIQLSVDPGNETRTNVTIINHTGHVDWFRVEVEGIPREWYQIFLPDGTTAEPAQVRLFHTPAHTANPSADAVAKLMIYFRPPKTCQSWAGVHPFSISATTQGEPQVRRVTTGQLTVGRFEDLSAEMKPEKIPQPRGEFTVELHNGGNDLINVMLAPIGEGLIFDWEQEKASLSNCAQQQVKLGARVKRRHWLGAQREYTLGVKVEGGSYKEELVGTLICQPRIPWWLQTAFSRIQPLLIPVMMLVVLAGLAFAFLRPPDVKAFKADPASVIVGTPVTLSWTIDRAKSVAIDPSSGNADLNAQTGKLKVVPTTTTTYTLTARNLVGISSSQAVNVDVRPAPVVPQIVSFTASPEHITKEGQAVILSWKTTGATKVSITPGDEIKNPADSGEATVHPSKNNTVYQLTATNDAGQVTATKTIIIDPPQIASFTASVPSVVQGGPVSLTWSASNFTKLTITASKGDVETGKKEVDVTTSSSETVNPLESVEYTLTATNAGGSATKVVKVAVTPMQIAFFKADPASISKGEQTMLSWNVAGADSITIQPDVGAVGPGQTSALVKPDKTIEYTLTATGAGNKKLQSKTTVTVGLGAVKIDFFTAAPTSITKGGQATLTYSVQNAKQLTIKGSDGSVVRNVAVSSPSVQGSVTVSPSQTTTYTLTATNDSGPTALPATVEVLNPTPTAVPTPKPAAPAAAPPAQATAKP